MFKLNIVTPQKKLVTDMETEEVFVPANRGQLDILPGHSPLVSTLHEGVLSYRLKGDSQYHDVAISWGYVQVTPEGVSILAETAQSKDEINLDEAQKELVEAEKSLSRDDITPEDIEEIQSTMRQAEAKITVAKGQTLH